jgi:hypothetical protein
VNIKGNGFLQNLKEQDAVFWEKFENFVWKMNKYFGENPRELYEEAGDFHSLIIQLMNYAISMEIFNEKGGSSSSSNSINSNLYFYLDSLTKISFSVNTESSFLQLQNSSDLFK